MASLSLNTVLFFALFKKISNTYRNICNFFKKRNQLTELARMSYHRSILLVGRCGYWFGHHNLALLGEFFSTKKPFLDKNEILEVI